MLKVVFLDDEPLALRQAELYAAKTPEVEVLAACTSASKALPFLELADALFVDINMPDISGMELVRSLPNPPLVIFTTAYAEYAVEGFRVNAVDYLLKPFGLADFQKAVRKALHILEMERAAAQGAVQEKQLHFKTDYKTVSVRLEDIVYVESMSEYIKIHRKGESVPLIVLYSLKHLMEQLPREQFMRIHRSYIISLAQIREASRTAVVLSDGTSLPVGEIYRPAFREYLQNFSA